MTPQERKEFEELKKLVASLERVEHVAFIKALERRLNFVSGTLALDDLSDVSTGGASNGQVLKFNGSSWAPGADNT